MRRFLIASTVFLLIIFEVVDARSQTTEFTYQGSLTTSGSPATGNYDFEFLLFDAFNGGSQLGSAVALNNIAVANGIFSVRLNFGNQFSGASRYLEIRLRPTGQAGMTILTPRQLLTSVPYSVKSLNAESANNATQLNGQAPSFYQNAGNLSVGTLPTARLPVPLNLTGSVDSNGTIYGTNTNSNGWGVVGNASATSGDTAGVFGQSSSINGRGVEGSATAFLGATYGVYGRSSSTNGHGVFGIATGTSGTTYGGYFRSDSILGYGVFGLAAATSGTTYGGYFRNSSTAGRAVFGDATATSGSTYGVWGQSESPDGRGVLGRATATSGSNIGGYFESGSTSGRGVVGSAYATTGATYGGYFTTATSSIGIGVYGSATAGTGDTYGVWGESRAADGVGVQGVALSTSGVTYGVLGRNLSSGAGFGVFSNGNMGASGTKSFRIDHPSDPQNKYLLHYSVESPEVLNTYSGKITLNDAGEAVVELPVYFAAINKDPRYTLSPIGAPMPMLHVAQEVSEAALRAGEKTEPNQVVPTCSFRIAGGVAGAKVSWRVEALRNDRWIRANGMPVEVEKQGSEKNTYQHPELFGQPKERASKSFAPAEAPLREKPRPPAN